MDLKKFVKISNGMVSVITSDPKDVEVMFCMWLARARQSFRDFLQLYNKMTEICFSRCIYNINSRNLDQNEVNCVDDCSPKFIKFNNKLMQNFVKAQTDIVNKRVEEAEKQQRLEAPEEKTARK
ncbi:hypothetical protein NQ318_003573 [Aromia moschata]|uniref:Mitochondrial import inner membrane translocase subunit n=1 Tax=Aromia moschata TaxID=1265417 RepID=A0AAV8YWT0_9CUCU|nr:hypothetical protein NQ318_003573 [Aromia moschata]